MLLKRWICAAAMALLLAALGGAGEAAGPSRDVFTVSPVAVDVTAANATAARDQAIAEGGQRAFRQLLERLTLAADRGRLPKPGAAQLNDLVQGFEVAHERRSGVRYLAEYTFHFRPEAVRQALRQAGIGYAETPSKPLIVLPVLHDGERTVLWDDPNPWREAWGRAASSPGLVALVRPLGEIEDVQAIDADAAAHGDDARLQAISRRYDDDDVLVTQATVKTEGALHAVGVTSTRYSPGTQGSEQTWVAAITANAGESDADMMGRAIAQTLAQVEEAWKRANIIDFRQTGTILARVPAGSLQDWIAVRDRLSGIASVRSSRLVSLDREGARVEISFAGDPAQLRLALAQRDLELSGNDPEWVLQRRSASAAPR